MIRNSRSLWNRMEALERTQWCPQKVIGRPRESSYVAHITLQRSEALAYARALAFFTNCLVDCLRLFAFFAFAAFFDGFQAFLAALGAFRGALHEFRTDQFQHDLLG